MTKLDLRTRVLVLIALVALLQVVVAFVVLSVTRDQLIDQVDDRLVVASSADRNSVFDDDHEDHTDTDLLDPADNPDDRSDDSRDRSADRRRQTQRLGDTYEGELTDSGRLISVFTSNETGEDLSVPDIDVRDARRSRGRPITVTATDDEVEYRLVADERDGHYFITAIPLFEVDETLSRLRTAVALTAAAMASVLGLLGWWVLRLGIGPIKRMTASAEAIAAGDLSERISDVDQQTEAGQLGNALNLMLGQIEGSFEERRLAEEKLRQFMADASHELRTPVATIRGYAELYQAGGLADPAELDDAMRRTEQESQRMSRLIADMLDLARLDRDPTLATRRVDLTKIALDATSDASATYSDRSITIGVPEGVLVVDGDEDLLRQMVANLLGNSIVHTDKAAVVNVELRADGDTVVLEVADNGNGMTPEVLARVTERFFRADASRSRHKGGSGLGLAIVKSIVKAHNGTLQLASTRGEGTTARVSLPLTQPL